ncbi:hypothetical protein B5C34_05045 [Pacificimonas flava]|uniref:Glycosyltransferase RgtA/B/C/D-like domain-containing protein n=2 Tax=Pacificimonas TaxID=1960290 RepID=A0A219B3N8_9SPHN|nr:MULTISPECIES: hypothetical protein [Pacificimonas]MBZ6377416.1 hypothetical protein [Pacificimonas aurantium]OWV32881.1 hypothetical protein B5C34_05045 [Pacificimonas flava]
MTSPPWRLAVLATWLFVTAFMLFAARGQFELPVPRGPDDLLRMVQVRDWLGGQAFADVSQTRLNTPLGAPMHWSRIVDAPIALVILLLSPLLGEAQAEAAAMVVIPALTLLAVIYAGTMVARQVSSDRRLIFLAPLFFAAVPLVAVQTWPFRIDHHGWQIALALSATAAIVSGKRLTRPALAGLFMAVDLAISIEGLPYAALLAAALAVPAIRDREQALALVVYVAVLAVVSAAIFALTQPATMWSATWCDALMPVYFGAFAVAGLGLLPLLSSYVGTPLRRAGVIAAAGLAAFAAILAIEPTCAAGPFARLDPIVQQHWYGRINEGLPLWHSSGTLQFGTALLFLTGVAGYVLALRKRSSKHVRTLAFLFFGAAILGILVMRASALATALAIPGILVLLAAALERTERVRRPWRLLASFGAIVMLFPATPLMAWTLASAAGKQSHDDPEAGSVEGGGNGGAAAAVCKRPSSFDALASMAPTRLLTQLDIAPAILYRTPHAVVASSHHRNNDGIAATLSAFLGDAEGDEARRLMQERGLTHLVICVGSKELNSYGKAKPESFAAALNRDEAPAWLTRVPAKGGNAALRIYQPSD